MMYEVWLKECSNDDAVWVGQAEGDTFREACDKLIHREHPYYRYYDSEKGVVWGNTLYPSRHEANGFRRSWSYTTGEELIIKVGEREVLRLPYRPMDNCTGICFPEAGWLAGKIKDMVDMLNRERYSDGRT